MAGTSEDKNDHLRDDCLLQSSIVALTQRPSDGAYLALIVMIKVHADNGAHWDLLACRDGDRDKLAREDDASHGEVHSPGASHGGAFLGEAPFLDQRGVLRVGGLLPGTLANGANQERLSSVVGKNGASSGLTSSEVEVHDD